MSYSQAQLATLQAALASGVLRVQFEDRVIHYRTMEELRQAIQIVEDALAGDLRRAEADAQLRAVQQGMSFARFARYISFYAGSSVASCVALALAILWLIAGPIVGWSDQWHLWASSVTTVITFLMVFNIQSTQNRDTAELKAMLRELVEDISEVDETRAHDRVTEEERP